MPAPEPSNQGTPEATQVSARAAADGTVPAPPCPPALPSVALVRRVRREPPTLAPGQVIDDYEVVRLLGDGGLARVYLARQRSLNRLVALKVSANQGSEARTLARLEHQHIVQVFAELVLAEQNLRLLSIQFIPGVTLACLIDALAGLAPAARSGQAFLGTLDRLCTEPIPFDLCGLEVRTFLLGCDHAELTCWLGARLCEALAHAHSQGVIHRDIKPANILVNRYGRPFLADFNIAQDTEAGPNGIGGTLPYMAPEQLDAFLRGAGPGRADVDERSDVYSLALVLFEFLTGQQPFARGPGKSGGEVALEELSRQRHGAAPSARACCPAVPEVLDRVLRRCLEPQPERRCGSAAALMRALDGSRDLLHADRAAAPPTRLMVACRARPFFFLTVLVFLPHLVGSIVNIVYNQQLVVGRDAAQQASFERLVLGYNSIVYPVLLVAAFVLLRRAWRGWRQLRTDIEVSADEAARCRRNILRLGGCAVALSCLGWFPGGLVFPLGMHLQGAPLPANDCAHFLMSFVLSGLIAATYAYFAVQVVVLRVLYPQLWSDPSNAGAAMQAELTGVPAQLRRYQFIAVLIPLIGAALLIGAGPDYLTVGFRVLVTALIVLGLAGFVLASRLTTSLCDLVGRLVGPTTAGANSANETTR